MLSDDDCEQILRSFEFEELSRDEWKSVLKYAPTVEVDALKESISDSESATSERDHELLERPPPVTPTKAADKRPRNTPNSSPYFSPRYNNDGGRRQRTGSSQSCIPFPPTTNTSFGLIQEEFAHDPFKLLIAVTFLNRTRGVQAIPAFRAFLDRYPTPEALAAADPADIVGDIQHLGLQNQRTQRYLDLGKMWIDNPPQKGRRYRKLHYPNPDDGRDIKPTEVLEDGDARNGAWEIAHLPTAGPYAIDSWRIFCRDELRGLASSWNSQDACEDPFEPEWKRVVPRDKELRAFLRWMWLREGWNWNPLDGTKSTADPKMLAKGKLGGAFWVTSEEEDIFSSVEALVNSPNST
ncbi:MAG: hypothetical protein M1825_004786 [Sarcosagium campestre]|nr:MAG: hypothetical protein M1825_004786 [Sarcosagium campestre]